MTDFTTALKTTAKAVNAQLEAVLPDAEGLERRLLSAMRYSTLAGGKRLRAFLVLASADLFEVDRRSALRVAAAIELVHTYSLVYDDLPAMDADDLRRDCPRRTSSLMKRLLFFLVTPYLRWRTRFLLKKRRMSRPPYVAS